MDIEKNRNFGGRVMLGLSIGILFLFFSNQSDAQEIKGIRVDSSHRYFQKSNKPFFFIGYYGWAPPVPNQRINSPATLIKMIDLANRYHLDYIRISMGINRFPATQNDIPFRYVNGKYDLDHWDTAYWKGLQYHAEYAAKKGIILHLAFFDGPNIRGGKAWWRYRNSPWNNKNLIAHLLYHFEQLDKNGNRNIDEPGEFYQKTAFQQNKGIGYYQRKLIDKTIATLAPYDNVFYEIGNETFGATTTWNRMVVKYIRSKTDKPITIDVYGRSFNIPDNAQGYASSNSYEVKSSLDLKKWLKSHVGSGMPVWFDSDAPPVLYRGHPDERRRAVWYSLTGGAAGWGGYQEDIRNEGANTQLLRDLQYIKQFLKVTNLPFWKMTPQYQWISHSKENSLLAKKGKFYLAYVRMDTTVKIKLEKGKYVCKIYNPETGNWRGQSILSPKEAEYIILRKPQGLQDWVVYIKTVL